MVKLVRDSYYNLIICRPFKLFLKCIVKNKIKKGR